MELGGHEDQPADPEHQAVEALDAGEDDPAVPLLEGEAVLGMDPQAASGPDDLFSRLAL